MKKLVNIAIFFAIGLLAKTNALAQSNVEKQLENRSATTLVSDEKNTVEANSKTFFVEGESNSEIKLELQSSHNVPLHVTIYDRREKIVLEKVLTQKGFHTINFESTGFEIYKVVVESKYDVAFVVEKRLFL